MPQFNIDIFPGQIFWFFIIFTFLYLVMSKFSLPKISMILEHRRKNIQNNIEKADLLRRETDSVLQQCEEAILEANQKAQNQIQKVKDRVSFERKNTIEECMQKISEKIQTAEKNISSSKKKAIKDIRKAASELTFHATEELINVKIDKKHIEKTVSELLDQV